MRERAGLPSASCEGCKHKLSPTPLARYKERIASVLEAQQRMASSGGASSTPTAQREQTELQTLMARPPTALGLAEGAESRATPFDDADPNLRRDIG